MSDVVFILGAGASRQGGAPLMFDFLDTAADLLFARKVKSTDSFQRVLQARGKFQAAHSKAKLDIDNIEALFTALELSKIIRTAPGGLIDDVPTLIADLKTVIVETLENTLLFPNTPDGMKAPKPYPEFAKLVEKIIRNSRLPRTAAVLTFNYDIAVDHALECEDLSFSYALSETSRESNVDLLKLHGSINWSVDSGESRQIRPMPVDHYLRQYFSTYNARGNSNLFPLRFSQVLQAHFQKSQLQVDPTPLIVPPSWNKSDYHVALSDVWARAAKHLSEAEYVFIIGYSLPETDAFFRHLYALGSIGERGFRRIEVFNPDSSTERRFLDLLGPGALSRFAFHAIGFDQAIPVIAKYFPDKK